LLLSFQDWYEHITIASYAKVVGNGVVMSLKPSSKLPSKPSIAA